MKIVDATYLLLQIGNPTTFRFYGIIFYDYASLFDYCVFSPKTERDREEINVLDMKAIINKRNMHIKIKQVTSQGYKETQTMSEYFTSSNISV